LQENVAVKNKLWYLDSGCSKHMIGDSSLLISFIEKHWGFVTYEDNNKGRILDRENIRDKDTLLIKDVLLVKGLKHNLLSLNQLCDKGFQVTFQPEICLTSASSRKTYLVGKRVNNLYTC